MSGARGPAARPPRIATLDPARDRARTQAMFERAADYIRLETGLPPDGGEAARFFAEGPPGADLARSRKFGQEAGAALISLADLAFGFPEADDAFIGLLLVDPACRGRGLGRQMLDHLARTAREAGARRLLVAVLEANPAGRRFWEREGFRLARTAPPRRYGDRIHVAHRLARPL